MKFLKYASAVITLVLSSNVNAALVSTSWLNPNDNLITVDTDTTLEWLDTTYTLNRSYNDISSEFGVGGEFEGWRYATEDDLITFFTNAGGAGTYNGQTNVSGVSSSLSSADTYIGDLVSIWGGFDSYGERSYARFIYDRPASAGEKYIGELTDEYAVNRFDRVTLNNGNRAYDGSIHPYIGHALVRGTSVSAVPVPAAVWLFGSGLIGLAGIARRKKA